MAPAWSFPRLLSPPLVGGLEEEEKGGPAWHGPAHLHPSLPVPTTDTCDLVCLNGGSCFLNARKQAKCRCQPRYNGEKCQIDQCWDYCQNGGTCAASPSGEAAGGKPGGRGWSWAD